MDGDLHVGALAGRHRDHFWVRRNPLRADFRRLPCRLTPFGSNLDRVLAGGSSVARTTDPRPQAARRVDKPGIPLEGKLDLLDSGRRRHLSKTFSAKSEG